MATMTISSKGQIVLPADIRRRFGLVAGTRIEIIEEPSGLRLLVCHPVKPALLADCAGMITAPSKGKARRLEDFDAADLTAKAEA